MNPDFQPQLDDLSQQVDELRRSISFHRHARHDGSLSVSLDATAGSVTYLGLDRITTNFAVGGFTINPSSSYHVLTAPGPRISSTTKAIANGAFVGQILVLEGSDDVNTIVIKNNALTKLAAAADVTLGANDILGLIWNGSNWLQLFTSNN